MGPQRHAESTTSRNWNRAWQQARVHCTAMRLYGK